MLSIAVRLTFSFSGLYLTQQVNLFLIQPKQSSWIQTSKTEGHPILSLYELSGYLFSKLIIVHNLQIFLPCQNITASEQSETVLLNFGKTSSE